MCNGYVVYEAARIIMMNPDSVRMLGPSKIYSLVKTEFSQPVEIGGSVHIGTRLNSFFLYHAYMGDCIFRGCSKFAEIVGKAKPSWRDVMEKTILVPGGVKLSMTLPGCFEKMKASLARSLALLAQAVARKELDPKAKPEKLAELIIRAPWTREIDGFLAVWKKTRLWRRAFEAAAVLRTTYPSAVVGDDIIFPIEVKDLAWYIEKGNELAEKTGFASYPVYGPAVQSDYDVLRWMGIEDIQTNGKCIGILAKMLSLIIRLFPEIHEEGKPMIDVVRKAYTRAVYAGLISIDKNGIWIERPYKCYLGSDLDKVLEKTVEQISEDDLGFLYYLFA